MQLQQKVIFITGGAQGIGGAAAELCAARGALVYIADINPELGEAAAQKIRGAGGQAVFIPLDVRDPNAVSAAFEQVRKNQGKLDGLICAAGVLKGAFMTPEQLPVEDFELVLDVNIKGVFLCAKYAAPLLEASRQGVMILIASGAGVVGPSSSLAYAASKGGANGLGMTLEAQLEARGIRVNTLCPGNIVTEMKMKVEIENAQRKGIAVDQAVAEAHRNYGTPEGVAKIIAFILSDEADYLRGTLFTR